MSKIVGHICKFYFSLADHVIHICEHFESLHSLLLAQLIQQSSGLSVRSVSAALKKG